MGAELWAFKVNMVKIWGNKNKKPNFEKWPRDPQKSIFWPQNIYKSFIPHILGGVYVKKSPKKNFFQKKWRGYSGLPHVYLRIPFIFDFQEDLNLKMPWRKRDSPFSPRLSPSSVNRPTSFIGILCFRLVCHGSCTVCVYYVVWIRPGSPKLSWEMLHTKQG